MEFLDEDARPRFVFQSSAAASSEQRATAAEPQSYQVIPLGHRFSLLIPPHSLPLLPRSGALQIAPLLGRTLSPPRPLRPSIHNRRQRQVGRGEVVNFPDPETEDASRKSSQRRSRQRRPEEVAGVGPVFSVSVAEKRKESSGIEKRVTVVEEEKEWSEEDVEVLKKEMVKNPVGKPGRWEAIAAAFGGRHRVESVIKKAKELGEKRADDSESYAQFLKKRKALDRRVVEVNEGESEGKAVDNGWSSAEDIALLNALKAFPKEVSMRWEKVAAAVLGRSKPACMKRFAELKKGFRTAKAAAE